MEDKNSTMTDKRKLEPQSHPYDGFPSALATDEPGEWEQGKEEWMDQNSLEYASTSRVVEQAQKDYSARADGPNDDPRYQDTQFYQLEAGRKGRGDAHQIMRDGGFPDPMNDDGADPQPRVSSEEENNRRLGGGFVSMGRKQNRHVPPRDFPHPHLHCSVSPPYPQVPQPSINDLIIPQVQYQFGDPSHGPNLMRRFSPGERMPDPSLYDDFELPSNRQQERNKAIQGPGNNNLEELCEEPSKCQHSYAWCEEQRDGESSNVFEFGVVGSMVDTFFPKPGDILILANERKGCPWPAFDGHMEIYVDDDYFSKISVALQWNYNFKDGDVVLRFGDFDRHWKWRPSDQIHVFLKDNGSFYLVSRQLAQELHPLDFKFVDPLQKAVHSIQYHFRPRVGDFVLRKKEDDSYLWNTRWWHPGGDSHLLEKHYLKNGARPHYPQGPPPKYRWTFHWYRRAFQFEPEDILLRVGYESAEDNLHTYCVCEIYFRTGDNLWTFQGRDDYTFGPPSTTVKNKKFFTK